MSEVDTAEREDDTGGLAGDSTAACRNARRSPRTGSCGRLVPAECTCRRPAEAEKPTRRRRGTVSTVPGGSGVHTCPRRGATHTKRKRHYGKVLGGHRSVFTTRFAVRTRAIWRHLARPPANPTLSGWDAGRIPVWVGGGGQVALGPRDQPRAHRTPEPWQQRKDRGGVTRGDRKRVTSGVRKEELAHQHSPSARKEEGSPREGGRRNSPWRPPLPCSAPWSSGARHRLLVLSCTRPPFPNKVVLRV